MGNACNGCFAGLTSSPANPQMDPNRAENVRDHKALAAAAQKGNVEHVSALLTVADPLWPDEGFFMYTALHLAAASGHAEVVRLLLEDDRVQGRSAIDVRSTSDETPFLMAARGRKREVCKLFLDRGADLEAKTNYKGNLARSVRSYLEEAGFADLLEES
ncbi:unnamed protein product [Amoebophrya sp. A120]|nr:unnamed protein product [Amoebophrya sp. A120]|eukprot:GSA120T00025894001.1